MRTNNEKRRGPSKAIVACDGDGHGVVLWYVGETLENESLRRCCCRGIFDENSNTYLDELGFGNAPCGLSVWEGSFGADDDGWDLEGDFRELTPEEWTMVQCRTNPWEGET